MRWGLGVIALVLAGCGGTSTESLTLRNADDIQVMTPEQVAAMKATATTMAPNQDEASPDSSDVSSDTIPLNQDDRPPELKLFDAFAEFRGCIEDSGETIRGNLQDPNNPAYQDPEYLQLVQKCAARSDIINVLNEVQATRESLTPEQIEQRNEAFKLLSDCLKKRGWTIETATDAQGQVRCRTRGCQELLDITVSAQHRASMLN